MFRYTTCRKTKQGSGSDTSLTPGIFQKIDTLNCTFSVCFILGCVYCESNFHLHVLVTNVSCCLKQAILNAELNTLQVAVSFQLYFNANFFSAESAVSITDRQRFERATSRLTEERLMIW